MGSSGAEKMSAAQNLLRVKLFKRELGSRRHYGHENAKNRRVVKDVCHRLGSSGAEKMSAAQNLLRVKLFKRELGSRRHYGHENAQKQASCERNLS